MSRRNVTGTFTGVITKGSTATAVPGCSQLTWTVTLGSLLPLTKM
jgi:hypothetical protein